METTVIEPDKTVESNVGGEGQQVAETATEETQPEETTESAEQHTEEVETQQEEPVIELDGEKIPHSQIKKWKEDYANDSKWKDKNKRESEELNRKNERVRRLELLEPMLEQHPEVLQQLFTPTKPRDFDAELKAHYQKRPTANVDGTVDINAYNEWEYHKDILLSERASTLGRQQAEEKIQQSEAKLHNDRIEQDAYEKYVKSGKITDDEFRDAARFIVENVAVKNGKVPAGAFDMAYKIKFEERWLSEMKIDATKKATEQVFKAQKGASEPGKKLPSSPPKTPQDKEDDEFVKRVKQRAGTSYTKL